MHFVNLLAVATGGALGSVMRYVTVNIAHEVFGKAFPYGTLLVNSLGSFVIGVLMYLFVERFSHAEVWRLLWVVGLLGGYTTFSSFAWETFALYQSNSLLLALINLLITNVLTLFFVALGARCSQFFI